MPSIKPTYPDHFRPLDFLELAEEFYQAFHDLPARLPPSWPRYFMLCHAIELAPKAYLAQHGATLLGTVKTLAVTLDSLDAVKV